MTERAEAGLKQKRETQLERVTLAIRGFCVRACEASGEDFALSAAKAAIAAYPDPYIKKERDRPRLPTDDCVLCAMRSEFVALVTFIEMRPDKENEYWLKAWALARALREQGVV